MSDLSEFYLNSSSSIIQYETLEISHSGFSQTYRLIRNSLADVNLTLEDSSVVSFTYCPMRIRRSALQDDLDQALLIDLGDVGQIIAEEVNRIRTAEKMAEYPILKYRTYRSDDLTAPLFGPWVLEIEAVNLNREGATFEAKVQGLNSQTTGLLYTTKRFPMLEGFLV